MDAERTRITKIYVSVDKNKVLIDSLMRLAFQHGFEIDNFHRPINLDDFSEIELNNLIEVHGDYLARTLFFKTFKNKNKGSLVINFFRAKTTRAKHFSEKFLDGQDEDDLKEITEWLMEQKNIIGYEIKKIKKSNKTLTTL